MTTRDLVAEAVERDRRDFAKLVHIHKLVTTLLDKLIPEAADLEHPDRKWQPDDLLEILQDQAKSIMWEINRVSLGPVVVTEDY